MSKFFVGTCKQLRQPFVIIESIEDRDTLWYQSMDYGGYFNDLDR